MEERLRPVNALISLVTPTGPAQPALAAAGFRLVALETPVGSSAGTVVIDAILFHETTGRLVLCEVKSGANIDEKQARCYSALSAVNVVRAARVTVRGDTEPACEVVYVCTEPNAERVAKGLDAVRLDFPLLVIGSVEARWNGQAAELRERVGALQNDRIKLPRPVPTLIPFDHETPADIIVADVQAGLVSYLTHREQTVSFTSLTELVARHYVLYGRQAKRKLVQKVAEAAQAVADRWPGTYEVKPAAPNDEGYVRLLRSPEALKPRGRTVSYQALAMPVGAHQQRVPDEATDVLPASGDTGAGTAAWDDDEDGGDVR